jgi:hypothetical protein
VHFSSCSVSFLQPRGMLSTSYLPASAISYLDCCWIAVPQSSALCVFLQEPENLVPFLLGEDVNSKATVLLRSLQQQRSNLTIEQEMSVWNLSSELARLRLNSSHVQESIDVGMLISELELTAQPVRNRGGNPNSMRCGVSECLSNELLANDQWIDI